MKFNEKLLEYTVCPECQGQLRYTREEVLFCVRCKSGYPLVDGIPDLSSQALMSVVSKNQKQSLQPQALLTLIKGFQEGQKIQLKSGCCMAIGRAMEENQKTQIKHMDYQLNLDSKTENLIQNYLLRTERNYRKVIYRMDSDEKNSLIRISDLILNDSQVSRLHAMIFYGQSHVGILDLVSRNGTFVNKKEVESCLLNSGDIISLGDTEIQLTLK